MDQQNRKQHLNEIQSACTDLKPKPKRRGPKPKVKLLVEPRVIRTIPKQKDHVNHSYSDYSNVPPEDGYIAPFKIDEMSFSEKLFDILKKETKYASCIAWRPHGRAFAINVPAMFEKEVCELYFGHKRYSSFLRQVNNYGFKHITAGNDRNCYYHEVRENHTKFVRSAAGKLPWIEGDFFLEMTSCLYLLNL